MGSFFDKLFKKSVKSPEEMDSEDHNLDSLFHLALCCYARQSYTESLNLFQKIADRGSKEAQYMLATQYEEGKGTDCNDTIAFRLYLMAAEQGMAKAQYKAGVFYANGKAGSENNAKAMMWIRKAAQQKYPMAQYHLGLMLAMEDNYDEAILWWMRAGMMGVSEASFKVGMCMEKGYGHEVDTELAKQWYLKAHEQGHFGAMVKYENLMEQ